MLQSIITAITTAQDGPEVAARRVWHASLKQSADERGQLCDAIAKYFTDRLTQVKKRDGPNTAATPLAPAHYLVEVVLAALYAVCQGLTSPLAWDGAETSRLRSRLTVSPEARPALHTAATFLVQLTEAYLLRTHDAAWNRFSSLLNETGMGVPLFTLVLYAYATAVTDVLADADAAESSSCGVDRCMEHLRLATKAFSLQSNEAGGQLTVAHPIYLHVARVGQRWEKGIEFFHQPVRVVNPILTGVGLVDYVAYYAEAALLLTSAGAYAAAFYALTPVHSLPAMSGLKEKTRFRGSNSSNNDAMEAYLSATKAPRAEGATGPRGGVTTAAASSSARASQHFDTAVSVSLYPWYRTRQVSATHTYIATAAGFRAEQGGEEVVEWRLILAPSPSEVQRDQQLRAWAMRLSLLLLALAFGGGNPREVAALGRAGSRADSTSSLESGGADGEWKGLSSSAMPDHVCFPNAVFCQLAHTTRISLESVVAAAQHCSSAEMQVYFYLLGAIAQRDRAGAALALSTSEYAAVLLADMTYELAQVAVDAYLPRHILLDTARLYTRVPLRYLMDRTQQLDDHDQQREEQQQQQQQAQKVLKLLAQLCASQELEGCDVMTATASTATTTAASSTAASPQTTSSSVMDVVAAKDFEQHEVDIDATSITFTSASTLTCLQLCACIVSPQMQVRGTDQKLQVFSESGTSDAALLQMLQQLQELHRFMKAEHNTLKGLH